MVKEPIRKDLFFLLAATYNISKLKLLHFGPCYLGSKGLQQACNQLELNKMVGEASGKLQFVQELEFWQSLFLFFVGPAKKKRAIKIKCAQTHFESVLGYYTSYHKNLSKILLSWGNLILQKGTKESKLSLGSWLAF